MCKKILCCIALSLVLGSLGKAADVRWTGQGSDKLWSNPDNWSSKQVPTSADVVLVDVPAALAPNGPVIHAGVEAKISGLVCEVAGEPTLTITGGTLDISQYIWWGDGANCFGTVYMSGGTVSTGSEFELGWGGGGGIWHMTGGTINAQELVIPTSSGAEGILYLYGGQCNVGNGGLSVTDVGLIDVGAGILVLEGDHVDQINDLINNGRIIAYSGDGRVQVDFNIKNPGMTTVTAQGTRRASEPQPANKAEDVPRNVVLSWLPGAFTPPTNGHIVYFGDNLIDVNEATDSVTQDVNSYIPDTRLDFETTYYWRVDEVNGAPDYTVHRGEIWSFTTEPFSYPVENIRVSASSVNDDTTDPNRTIDGSGLDGGLHSNAVSDVMWMSASGDPSPWLMYELVYAQRLEKMLIWNSNHSSEAAIGWGIKDVDIEVSMDGVDWTLVPGVGQITRGPGFFPSEAQAIDLGFVRAKYIRLNILSNWGGFLPQYGVAEIQFLAIPTQARAPIPADGAKDIHPDTVVAWRSGREAEQSTIYVDADVNAVAEGTAASLSSNTNSVSLGSLDLQMNQTYYWRVDEVNNAEDPSVWAGPVWSLSTASSLIVDDFESYNNFSPDRPFQTWLDGVGYSSDEFFPAGYGGNGTGAGVGHDIWSVGSPHFDGSIMERTIIRPGSGHSMPFYYNNTGTAASQTDRTWATPQDWTVGGAETLVLHFYGATGNTGQLYVKINNTKIAYDGDASNLGEPGWHVWSIDLSSRVVTSVSTLSVGVEGANANGLLLVDDILLQ